MKENINVKSAATQRSPQGALTISMDLGDKTSLFSVLGLEEAPAAGARMCSSKGTRNIDSSLTSSTPKRAMPRMTSM